MPLPMDPHPTSVEQLGVHRLQEFLLAPMLGITDPRRDENISFVGGIRGTRELEQLVDEGKGDMAVSMYPTQIVELVRVSDEGLLMHCKSTSLKSTLRSGLLIHTFYSNPYPVIMNRVHKFSESPAILPVEIIRKAT